MRKNPGIGRERRRGRSEFLLLAALSGLLAGCGLFSPRTPEAPSENPTPWDEPILPAIVLSNLEAGYEWRDVTSYLRSFQADSFYFQADHRDTSDPGTAWRYRDWGFVVEQDVTTRILAESDSVTLDLSPSDEPDDIGVNEATLYRDYVLRLYRRPELYGRGIARFTLHRDLSGYWSIVRWEDFRADTTDWGEIKGLFR
jgi:hypothetical protein